MSDNNGDVGAFHHKFGIDASPGVPRPIPEDVRDFRLRFLLEELSELADAYGLELKYELARKEFPPAPCPGCGANGPNYYSHRCPATPGWQDLPKIFDSLLDLNYVSHGTAHLHLFPWDAGWDEVQRANMSKERAVNSDDSRSTRKHSLDVIKPADFQPPNIVEVLMRAGWRGPSLPLVPE